MTVVQIGHYEWVTAMGVLRSVLRAEVPPDTLASIGFTIQGEAHHLRIDYPAGPSEIHTFPLSDLAIGFLRASGVGTELSRWASVVVMTDWIEIADIDTEDGRMLWDAVWSVAGDDKPGDDALRLARRLSGA